MHFMQIAFEPVPSWNTLRIELFPFLQQLPCVRIYWGELWGLNP